MINLTKSLNWLLKKEPELMESKMSKEEMTQFSLIIKEAINESNKSLTQEIASIKTEFTSFKNDVNSRFDKIDTRLDGIESRLDRIENRLDRIENTPTIKKELGL